MEHDFRQAIILSAESFASEYDPNENRRVDINTAINLVKKLKIIKHNQECSICFDSANNNKVVKLPCCNNKICQLCIINTITYNNKDCPMCRKDLVATINTTPAQQNEDSNNEISTPQQPSTINTISNKSVTKNTTKNTIKYKLKKCQPTPYKDPDTNISIRTQKYTFISETSEKSRTPIEIIYHNNNEVNRRRFETFLLDYKTKIEHGKILDESKIWTKLCNITYTFTDKYKFKPKYVSDSIFNSLYEKLNILVNTNTVVVL